MGLGFRELYPERNNMEMGCIQRQVAVSVELSLIDAVHRDFLRAILAQKRGKLDALIYVTSTFKEPKFRNVKRDIEIFDEILTVPILLVGLT